MRGGWGSRWLALLAITSIGGCAHLPRRAGVIQAVPSTQSTVELVGRFLAGAHACVISPHVAITAAHVLDLRPFDRDVSLYPAHWSAKDGEAGVFIPGATSSDWDLAWGYSRKPFPMAGTVAEQRPALGSRLWVEGFDWRRGRAYAPRIFDGRVLRIVADHIITDFPADLGSSGACCYDASGHIVGVFVRQIATNGSANVGTCVGTWGDLINAQRSVVIPEETKP